jgi:hypothetical protein
VLKDVTPNSTITWNSKGYINIGTGSATVKAEVLGTFYAADYITLGATNTMGLIGCTVGPYVPMVSDHFLISHDTSSIHCAPETVSVSAKNLDSSTTTGYTGTTMLDTQLHISTGTWSLLTGKGVFNDATDDNGEATYRFDAEDKGVAIFSLYYPDGAATFNIDVLDNANSTIRDKELDPEHNITFAASGFTVTAEALTDPSSIDNDMPTQIAGSASNLHLTAYGTSANDPQCCIIDLTASIVYLGTDIVTTTLSRIGRFTPASLSLTVINDGTFISANTDGALNFTYVGQPFSYDPADRPSLRVTALNASSPATLTSNYSGAWGKLNADSIEFTEPTSDEIQHGIPKPDGTSTRMVLIYAQGDDGFRDLKNTDNQPAAVNGIFDATFTDDEFTYDKDSNSQISPFTPNVNLIIEKVTDADGIRTGSITLNPTGPESIRFGRMRMYSAHGSEIEPLEMAYRLEYFDSPDWLLHDDKNSTITTGDISSNPTGISATSIKQTTPEGKFYITLSPPGLGNDGAYSITTDVLGSGEHWLQYDWDNDENFDDNPSGTATFGIHIGHSHQIFSSQAFQ